MDPYPPYICSVVLAKRAELECNLVAATQHLADALRLTREPGDVLQIEKWVARLRETINGRQKRLPIFDEAMPGKPQRKRGKGVKS
jgi:hypothetical protein